MVDRRTVTKGLAGAGAAIWASKVLRAGTATEQSSPVAKTAAGSIRGTSNGRVLKFLGVPYGAPTGGASRFVWTPGLDSGKRPVMVWLHGGGFAMGSGSDSPYDGTRLCTRGDIVVVTLNHRLNTFGYLYLGDIGGERFAQSGNVGMLDIVTALEWVRDNIAGFGGAGKVSVVCAMPAAKGLFHKAIMQSGPSRRIADKEHATAIARQLMKDLGLASGQVSELQTIEAAKLRRRRTKPSEKLCPAL